MCSVSAGEVVPRFGIVFQNGSDRRTGIEFYAPAAGFKAPPHSTRTYFAHGAVATLHAVGAAAEAVDRFGCNIGNVIHFVPFPGGLFPQGVVVRQRACRVVDLGRFVESAAAVEGDRPF